MSETKTFEELFLSESKNDNLSIKELEILLVSDIHKSYPYLEKLKEWQIENKKLFDYIFCTGDILSLKYPEIEDNEVIAKSEAEISAIISFLENMCLNVIYIGGNHDPKSLFNSKDTPTLTIRSTNLHKKHYKISNDLYLVGLGGSVPALESVNQINEHGFTPYLDVGDKVLWDGYPYQDNFENPSYKNSDKMYISDLLDTWYKSKGEIEEINTTPNKKYILLTHCGPFYSSTSIMENKNKCVYMGSQNLQEFLKNNSDIFLNIHGHTHKGHGRNNMAHVSVINPGSLSEGNFAVLKLKRNFIDEWTIAETDLISLI
jgi:Icc-related predicted phosphoesterase